MSVPARVQKNLQAGLRAIDVLKSRCWIDHAATMHSDVMHALEDAGFYVEAEVGIWSRTGKHGRIDIVAEHGIDGIVGIELDCRKPRLGSIAKLQRFDGYRIIGTRGVSGHWHAGIDACVAMRVSFANAAVKADRRIYRDRAAPQWAHDWKGAL